MATMQRGRKVLTAASVRAHKPGAQRREIPDGGAPGLYLVIQPFGAKSWAMRYRRPRANNPNATAKLTLGTVDITAAEGTPEPVMGGHLTLAAARRLAAEVHRQRALGRDPASDYLTEKRRARAAADERARSTFGAAARSFVEGHARVKTRRWHETARLLGLRPGDLEVIRGGLAERWRDKPVVDIGAHDIHALVDEVRRRGVPGLERRREGTTESRARAMLACLSKFFAWLVAHRVVEKNPCAGVHRPDASPARDRVLSDDEIRWFWSAAGEVGEPFGALLKLLLLTGQRLNEVARMTRDELSEDTAIWTISGTRTKNRRSHVVPLPRLAQEVLAGIKQIAGKRGYVFTTTGNTPVSGFSKIKARLDRAMGAAAGGTTIPPWRLHDLRRTAASGMARAGADLHVIERTLNHVSGSFGGIVGVYQRHRYADEVRAALEAWEKLLRITTGRTPRKDVVPKRPRT
jgi:integrase